MSKTIKQLADGLGVSKQRVYRFIKKNHISEAYQRYGVMYYDDVAESFINSHFIKNDRINEAHQKHISDTVNDTVFDTLMKQQQDEILYLREQVKDLHQLLDQEQQLHMATKKEIQLLLESTEQKKKTGFFKKIFGE
jgi:hypothetical protein